MAVPYTFGSATAAIPLSNLDSNFATTITLGNTAIQLGNTVTTLNNMTLANVTVSSGSVTLTNIAATTANVTTANIGTAVITGTSTLTGLTASTALALDASKNIASVTNTGSGNNVLGTSPTIATPTISTITSAAGTALTLQSNNGNTAVTVDTSQNVLVGATSFAYTAKLNVSGSQYMTGGSIENWAGAYNLYNSTTNSSGIQFYKGTSAISGSTRQAVIECQFDTLFNIKTDAAIPIIFATNASERMRIDSSGVAMFNTTAQLIRASETFRVSGGTGGIASFKTNNSGTPTIAVQNTNGVAVYVMAFSNSSGEVGTISTNTGVTLYNTTSDYRLKENVAPMTGALAKIAALKPVTYKWKSDGADGEGFIAHELAEVFPVAVTGAKDAVDDEGNPRYQGIDTSQLIATLTAAIQEQQALITSLTARIAALEAK
jgi:Chaperone of endosialidase